MRKDEKMKTEGKDYFAAVNSGKGFISFYDEIFNGKEIARRYLIKGGPGTGKSTLMRRVADNAQKMGMNIERYRCSSDPSSLDGVIIGGCVAIIDSTAPHIVEAELAGARDILVDLGAFWDSERLYCERKRISLLGEKKKHAYALAYRFLAASMQSDIAARELIMPYVDKKRIARISKRLTREIAGDGGYRCKTKISRAIGMRGRCALDTYASLAKKVVYIEEHYGMGHLVLCEICEDARRKGCRISLSYDPLLPDIPDMVFFEESGLLFALCEPRIRGAVSLRRALDMSELSKREKNEIKAKSRGAKRLSDALVLSATDELKIAGEAHFELEKIYSSCMDFSALDTYSVNLVKEIVEFAGNIGF